MIGSAKDTFTREQRQALKEASEVLLNTGRAGKSDARDLVNMSGFLVQHMIQVALSYQYYIANEEATRDTAIVIAEEVRSMADFIERDMVDQILKKEKS